MSEKESERLASEASNLQDVIRLSKMPRMLGRLTITVKDAIRMKTRRVMGYRYYNPWCSTDHVYDDLLGTRKVEELYRAREKMPALDGPRYRRVSWRSGWRPNPDIKAHMLECLSDWVERCISARESDYYGFPRMYFHAYRREHKARLMKLVVPWLDKAMPKSRKKLCSLQLLYSLGCLEYQETVEFVKKRVKEEYEKWLAAKHDNAVKAGRKARFIRRYRATRAKNQERKKKLLKQATKKNPNKKLFQVMALTKEVQRGRGVEGKRRKDAQRS